MNNATESAFPNQPCVYPNGQVQEGTFGLTKREYIATQIVAGICASSRTWPSASDSEYLAVTAVAVADALLAELAK